MAPLTRTELYAFHHTDRQVFSRLVKEFLRDPGESLLVIALWLWLELKGYPNIIVKLVSLPELLVFSAADEAALCLYDFMDSPSFPEPMCHGGGVLPVTSSLMEREFTLRSIQEHKFSVICGVRSILNNVCSRIFTDMLEDVLGNPTQIALNRPLAIPRFPHPLFGNLIIVPRPPDLDIPTHDPWAWDPANDSDECDRTVFLTFSRGFPVSEEEVRRMFFNEFGPECVSKLFMQAIPEPGEQRLYAKLILNSMATVDRVLEGKRIAKFQINGKHIWVRKYQRRWPVHR